MTATMTAKEATAYKYHIQESFNSPDYFNSVILGRDPYWSRQLQICDLVVNHRTTCVVSGNGVGKSYIIAGLALWFLYTRPYSMVVTTAPTSNQLVTVLWSQIRQAYYKSRFPLGGNLVGAPIPKLSLAERWYLVGITTTAEEKISGQHAGSMMLICDEASGIESAIFSAIDGMNVEKLVMVGNPLRVDGHFYETCQKALNGRSPNVGFAQISSMESPDILMERSLRGMADQGWLDDMRDKWGEASSWWKSHILGLFPDSNEDALIPREWLDMLAPVHVKSGLRVMGVDYSEGVGADQAVVLCRDDNGVLDWKASNTWPIEELANVVSRMAKQWDVNPCNITWDATAAGNDFQNRLSAVGLHGCFPYRGANKVKSKCNGVNLRSNTGWMLRRRFDPTRRIIDKSRGNPIQPRFFIPEPLLTKIRPELQALSYSQHANGRIQLTPKESLRKMLGRSPDLCDALLMSFAFHQPYNG